MLCLYSSGSTGLPKRVVRTHANLLFELSRLCQTLRLDADDRLLGIVPFSHVNGLVLEAARMLEGYVLRHPGQWPYWFHPPRTQEVLDRSAAAGATVNGRT